MSGITTVAAPATQASQIVQAGQAGGTAGSASANAASGLPPVGLAGPASANTVNAELVASQWGVDPASVAGVYGGPAENGGLFAGDALLPLLTSLSRANAEQALALIGISTPTPGGASGAGGTTAAGVTATSSPDASAPDQGTSGSSGAMVVDPLWGRSA